MLDAGKRILVNNFIFKIFISNATTNFTHLTDNLESNSDKLSIDQKEELSSSRPLCYWNDAVSENCKNEGMYNANPCNTPWNLKQLET